MLMFLVIILDDLTYNIKLFSYFENMFDKLINLILLVYAGTIKRNKISVYPRGIWIFSSLYF